MKLKFIFAVLVSLYLPKMVSAETYRNVLIMNITFLDGSDAGCTREHDFLGCHCSSSAINDLWFNNTPSVNSAYLESSYGQYGVTGEVIDVQIDANANDPCDYQTWWNQADAAAQALGYNLSNYDSKFYEMPDIASCHGTGSGWATIGGNRASSYYCDNIGSAVHELGHNLGFGHEAFDGTGDFATLPYSNPPSDPMGNFWFYLPGELVPGLLVSQFNAPNKSQMGWISPSVINLSSGPVTTTVDALDSSSGIRSIKVTAAGSTSTFHASLRTSNGLENVLSAPYPGNTSVHKTISGDNKTYIQKVLTDGTNYSDTVAGIRIAQNSHTASSVSLTVSDIKAPTAPTGVSGSSPSKGKANLTWSASTDNVGVSGYLVFRSTSQNGTYTDVTSQGTFTAATAWNQTGLAKATYWFKLKASDVANNQSAYSTAISINVK
jgi:hypothetical protein